MSFEEALEKFEESKDTEDVAEKSDVSILPTITG